MTGRTRRRRSGRTGERRIPAHTLTAAMCPAVLLLAWLCISAGIEEASALAGAQAPTADASHSRVLLASEDWAIPVRPQPGDDPQAARTWSQTEPARLPERIVSIGSQTFILAPTSLYRFDPSTESWSRSDAKEGLPHAPLRTLFREEEAIWVGGLGVSASASGKGGWQRFGFRPGEPEGTIWALEADEDYVYAGGDGGLFRYDRFTMEWEEVPPPEGSSVGQIYDLALMDESIWLATSQGLFEFRPQTESFIPHPLPKQVTGSGSDAAASAEVLRLLPAGGYLWVLSRGGIGRMDPEKHSWLSFEAGGLLPDAAVNQIETQGASIWLATEHGLWIFDAGGGLWHRHRALEDLGDVPVLALEPDGEDLWIATHSSLLFYDSGKSKWSDFTRSVPADPHRILAIRSIGGYLILLFEDRIVWARRSGTISPSLYTFIVEAFPAAGPTSQTTGLRLYTDRSGLHLDADGKSIATIKGGSTLEWSSRGTSPTSVIRQGEWEERTDVSCTILLQQERQLSGFYDSSDPRNESYQATYRGRRDDFLRSAAAGEIQFEPFNAVIMEGFGLEGGSLRLEAGGRRKQAGRRTVTLDLWAGRRRTHRAYEVFEPGEKMRRSFRLAHRNVLPGSETVLLDGEPLSRGTDYLLICSSGHLAIFDRVPMDPSSSIEVSYSHEPRPGEEARAEREEVGGFLLGFSPIEWGWWGVSGTQWESTGSRIRTATASGRLEWKGPRYLLRLRPEASIQTPNASDSLEGASGLAAAARFGKIEASVTARHFGKRFAGPIERQTLIGQAQEDLEANARIRSSWLEIEGRYSGARGAAKASVRPSVQWAYAALRSSKSDFPSLSLEVARHHVLVESTLTRKDMARFSAQYEPPRSTARILGAERIWVGGHFQRSWRSLRRCDTDGSGLTSTSSIADDSYWDFNASFGGVSLDLRWSDRHRHGSSNLPWFRRQRLKLHAYGIHAAAGEAMLEAEAVRENKSGSADETAAAQHFHGYPQVEPSAARETFIQSGARRKVSAYVLFHPGVLSSHLRSLTLLAWGQAEGSEEDPHRQRPAPFRAVVTQVTGALHTTRRTAYEFEARWSLTGGLRILARTSAAHSSETAPMEEAGEHPWAGEESRKAESSQRRSELRLEASGGRGEALVRYAFSSSRSSDIEAVQSKHYDHGFGAEAEYRILAGLNVRAQVDLHTGRSTDPSWCGTITRVMPAFRLTWIPGWHDLDSGISFRSETESRKTDHPEPGVRQKSTTRRISAHAALRFLSWLRIAVLTSSSSSGGTSWTHQAVLRATAQF